MCTLHQMERHLNVSRPVMVPLRFGTGPYPVQARLVELDRHRTVGFGHRDPPRPGHVMCRIPGPPKHPDALGYSRCDGYVWLRVDDIIRSTPE